MSTTLPGIPGFGNDSIPHNEYNPTSKAEQLESLRTKLETISYNEIARRTEISVSAISYIFRGHKRPGLDIIVKLAKALDVDTGVMAEFLNGIKLGDGGRAGGAWGRMGRRKGGILDLESRAALEKVIEEKKKERAEKSAEKRD